MWENIVIDSVVIFKKKVKLINSNSKKETQYVEKKKGIVLQNVDMV